MASLIRVRPELLKAMLAASERYRIEHAGVLRSEMGVALLTAGLATLSDGMNEEQVRSLIEQCLAATAPIRALTLERWKRTGFDNGLGPGKES